MGIVTRILVRNLSEATSVRLNGATEVYMDTPEAFRIPMSKDVEKLSNANKIKIEGALRTSVDQTEVNNAVLVDFFTPLTVDNRRKWLDVLVTVDEIPTSFSRMYVVAKNDDAGQWEVEFAFPEDHWVELATQKKINTIDFGAYFLTKGNILSTWAAPKYEGDFTPTTEDGTGWNGAYWWPIVDYGNWVDQLIPLQNTTAPVKILAVEDLRPFVNYVYLLKRGFCEIGYTLGGLIFQTEWALRLWVYLLKEQYYDGSNEYGAGFEYGRNGRVVGRLLDADETLNTASEPITFDTVEFSLGTNALQYQGGSQWLAGIKNNFPFSAKFRFQFQFHLQNGHAAATKAGFVIAEVTGATNDDFTGLFFSTPVEFDIGAGTTDFISFEETVTLEPGQKGFLRYLYGIKPGDKIKKGFSFRVDPVNESLSRFDYIDVRTIMRDDLNLMDALKAFVHLIKGRIETDYATKTVNVYPERTSDVYTERVAGFIQDDEPAENVGPFVLPDSIKLQFIRPNMKRYTRLSFADAADTYIDSLNLLEPLHSRKINNGNDLPDEVDELQNPVFEPTAEGQPVDLKKAGRSPSPYLPRLWDNTDLQRSFNIGPRIVYAFDPSEQINPEPVGTFDTRAEIYFDGYEEADRITEFGYATQVRTWELDPTPTLDGSVIFGRKAYDLFSNFYLGLTNDNRGGVVVDLLQLVSMAQYNQYNFRRLFSFQYEGRSLRLPMTGIRDFSPDIPTPVTYFGSPVETGCCDLPCSCRFTECDYYQDFGVFMRQTTLDSLNISSFKVDNIEQLAAPVEFGQMNIISIGGKQYVTNLVDTLNSIEVPYFFFDYSTRAHAAKGLRFFKIKRPACQTFEIIISDVGDEVYKYTESEQAEQWFAGSWGAIGYVPETFTAPDNCVTTVEY
jgi:hypothetical protein